MRISSVKPVLWLTDTDEMCITITCYLSCSPRRNQTAEVCILYHNGYNVVLQFGSVGLYVAEECCSNWSVMKESVKTYKTDKHNSFKAGVNQNVVHCIVMAIFIHSADTNRTFMIKKTLPLCLTMTWAKNGFEVKTQLKQFWFSFRLHTNQGLIHINFLHAPWEIFTEAPHTLISMDLTVIHYSPFHSGLWDAAQVAQNTQNLLYATPLRLETHFIKTEILNA